MASHNEIARRWAEQVGTERPRYIGGRSSNVFVDRERIWSYGSHFEMGRLVGTRERGFFLLNGDRYSPTTTQHQGNVRAAVAATGIPSMIVPYSALEAAGIDKDSIRPLDLQPERTDRWTEDSGPAWSLDDPRAVATWEDSSYGDSLGAVWRRWRVPGESVVATETLRGYDYSNGGFANYSPGENVRWYTSSGSGVEVIDGRFRVERYRHFLGACVFTARVAGRKGRTKFLSAFDENERQPLYFLAELPRTNARTYQQALDALAPRIVHAALAQGREVQRQGDIFAIPTNLTKAELRKRGAEFAKHARALETDHVVTEAAIVGGALYARGTMRHQPSWRNPDHAMRKMGKTWHLIVRNTVPRASRRVTAGRAL